MIAAAFILGLMGSLHCLGMCGPIAFMLPVNRQQSLKGGLQLSTYHLGRLSSYALLGLLFGILGKGLVLFASQQKLSIVMGSLMILFVLIPTVKGKLATNLTPIYKVVAKLKGLMGAALRRRTPETFLFMGLLNGLLPCGMVYMAVMGSLATGHPADGSLFMLAFGLGTVPMMSAAVYLGNFAGVSLREKFRKWVPVVVVLIGLLFIIRGLGLGIPYLSPAPVATVAVTGLDCHP